VGSPLWTRTPGWAVGDSGSILSTTDGGVTWMPQSSGTTDLLNAVSFVDINTGWVVMIRAGLILSTTDGGAHWTPRSTEANDPLYAVSFVDADTGTAVGAFGTLVRTTDGGVTWMLESSGRTDVKVGVSFVDANTGWAVGGTILHTNDGGATWTDQGYGGAAVSFVDANTGWAVGERGTILSTTDGGATWTPQASGTNALLTGVSFADANSGWAVGYEAYDVTVLHTENGGRDWVPQVVFWELPPFVCLRPGPRSPARLYGVSSSGVSVGSCTCAAPGCGPRPMAIRGGQLRGFFPAPPLGDSNSLRAVAFSDAQHGIAVGDFQSFNGFGRIIAPTADGGASWSFGRGPAGPSPTYLLGVSFLNPSTATVVGHDSQGGLILRTTDGGVTWTRQSTGTNNFLYGVSFVDSNTGWAVGSGGTILHTTTGGE
jgi:photosystem II stability/assembly factor-like uncharacterized protein